MRIRAIINIWRVRKKEGEEGGIRKGGTERRHNVIGFKVSAVTWIMNMVL